MMIDRRMAEAQRQIDEEDEKDDSRDQIRKMVVDAIVDGYTMVEIGDDVEPTLLDAFGDYVLELAQQYDYDDTDKSRGKYFDAYCLALWTVTKGDTDPEIRDKRESVAMDFVNDNFDAWEHLV